MIHYITIFGMKQEVVFIYSTRGQKIFLEFGYPITWEQNYYLRKNSIESKTSKSLNSGYRQYKDCCYIYANVNFTIDDGLDFDAAFGYLIRSMEKLLKEWIDSQQNDYTE